MHVNPILLKYSKVVLAIKNDTPDLSTIKIRYTPIRKKYDRSYMTKILHKFVALMDRLPEDSVYQRIAEIAYYDYLFRNFSYIEENTNMFNNLRGDIISKMDDSYSDIGLDYPYRKWLTYLWVSL